MKTSTRLLCVTSLSLTALLLASCGKVEKKTAVTFPKGLQCPQACQEVVFSPYVQQDKTRGMFWVFDRCQPFYTTYFPGDVYKLSPKQEKKKKRFRQSYHIKEKISYMAWEARTTCQEKLKALVKNSVGTPEEIASYCKKVCKKSSKSKV